MSRAIEEANKKFGTRSWTAGNVESYLKVNRLNTFIIKNVTENAWNVIIYKEAVQRKKEEPITYKILSEEKMNHPSRFECWKIPSY